MTLEDFFTLTEMKDGLAVPARVKDLVNVMHREKDSIVKSMGDMTRQWSTVASTIIATEDKDCLELFIQLDGLCFIDRWLNDAQRFSVETSDNFVEESITVLLRALEKLQVGYERSSACGILLTVENLLKHGSSRVQDGAKALFDQWKKNGDADQVSVEHTGTDTSLPNGGEEKCDEHDTNERIPVISADDVEKETILEKEVKEDDKRPEFTAVENSSKEESVVVVIADSVGKENDSFTPVVFDEVIEERSNIPIPSDCAADDDDDKQVMPMENDSTGKLHAKVGSSVVEDDLQSYSPMQIDDCQSPENENATFPTEDNGEVDELEEDEDSSEENKELTINLNLLKPAIICKVPNSIDEKRSDIELDYSIVDALEVARQVAIDVEREVGDHREPSCSNSSEKKQSIDPTSMKDEEEPSSSSNSSSRNSRETLNPQTENSSPLTVSSTEINVDKESEANSSGKGLIGLDLNQDVCSEDIDQPEKPIPTHISQVSASRAAAVSELASSPLQQQPEDGWKGSATTSAFRRVLEGNEKTPPAEMNRNFLDFDLNVADEEEDEKATRPMLDLNIISDDSDSVPDQSSFKKKIGLDLNLNDDDSHSYQHQSSSVATFQSISIMGKEVQVGKREPITQSSSSSIKDQLNLPRTGVGFFSFGPPTLQYPQMGQSSQFSLSPYMVDPTRGGPVLPQSQFYMMGPPPAGGGHYNGAGGGHYNGAGSSSSSNHNHHRIFDLNMGTATNEGGNRESVGFRQFLSMGVGGGVGGQNNNRMMEEQQLRGSLLQQHQQQPSSSSSSSGYAIGKRKEAEGGGGWEGYPYLKRQQPPWK